MITTPQTSIEPGLLLNLQESLASMFRIALEGEEDPKGESDSERAIEVVKQQCNRLSKLLDDDFFRMVRQVIPVVPDAKKNTTPKSLEEVYSQAKATFFFEVWEHVYYFRLFQGLDLGSTLQAVLHTRLVAWLLHAGFGYVHSFVVLRSNSGEQDGSPYLHPLLCHTRNAPCFPSGAWIRSRGWFDSRYRFDHNTINEALVNYAKRLCAEEKQGVPVRPKDLCKLFDPALNGFISTDGDEARIVRLDEEEVGELVIQFANMTRQLTEPWESSRGPDIHPTIAAAATRITELMSDADSQEIDQMGDACSRWMVANFKDKASILRNTVPESGTRVNYFASVERLA